MTANRSRKSWSLTHIVSPLWLMFFQVFKQMLLSFDIRKAASYVFLWMRYCFTLTSRAISKELMFEYRPWDKKSSLSPVWLSGRSRIIHWKNRQRRPRDKLAHQEHVALPGASMPLLWSLSSYPCKNTTLTRFCNLVLILRSRKENIDNNIKPVKSHPWMQTSTRKSLSSERGAITSKYFPEGPGLTEGKQRSLSTGTGALGGHRCNRVSKADTTQKCTDPH